jgi:hypothetical protein
MNLMLFNLYHDFKHNNASTTFKTNLVRRSVIVNLVAEKRRSTSALIAGILRISSANSRPSALKNIFCMSSVPAVCLKTQDVRFFRADTGGLEFEEAVNERISSLSRSSSTVGARGDSAERVGV